MNLVIKIAVMAFYLSACAHHQRDQGPSSTVPVSTSSSVLNSILPDLSLEPLNGPPFRLSEFKGSKAVVIVMREKDCPISEKYSSRLKAAEEKYSENSGHYIKFIYNYVGQVRPDEDGPADLKRHGFKGPYLIDKDQKLTKVLSAKTTGDVFVLNPDRRVIYRGPVDDQYHLLRAAPNIKNNYLLDVLEQIIAQKPVVPKELPAPGCIISPPIKG